MSFRFSTYRQNVRRFRLKALREKRSATNINPSLEQHQASSESTIQLDRLGDASRNNHIRGENLSADGTVALPDRKSDNGGTSFCGCENQPD